MAFNPFIGRDQKTLECDLKAAQDDLAAGKTIVSSGVGETRKSERLQNSTLERIRLILAALSAIAPTLYPPCQVSPDRTTRAVFRPDQIGCDPNQTICQPPCP